MKKSHFVLIAVLTIILYTSCKKDEPTENKAPTCTITSPDNGEEIQQGQTVIISADANDTDGNVTEVLFYVDGTGIGSSSSFPYDYYWITTEETVGNHTIKAIAKDNTDSSTTDEIIIEIVALAPIAEFKADKTEITKDETITFTDQSSNIPTSWNWNFGDGTTSTQQNPTHEYTIQGAYAVTLTATNNFGNDTETKTDYITVTSESGSTDTVSDIDGNTYNTVTIGTQEWMAENLKVTHYPDGMAILHVTDSNIWANLADNDIDDAYCYYDNNSSSEYGALYTYAAAKNACPTGWHLPTDAEWTTLENFISNDGHENMEGIAFKSKSGWSEYGNGTDDYGFTALPGGYRLLDDGTFSSKGYYGIWWSSTEKNSSAAYCLDIYITSKVHHTSYAKSFGYSVRCLRD